MLGSTNHIFIMPNVILYETCWIPKRYTCFSWLVFPVQVGIDEEESVSHQETESSVEGDPEAPLSATKKKKDKDDKVEGQRSVSLVSIG